MDQPQWLLVAQDRLASALGFDVDTCPPEGEAAEAAHGNGVAGTTHSLLVTGLTPDALHLVRARCTPEAPAQEAGSPLPDGDFYIRTPCMD